MSQEQEHKDGQDAVDPKREVRSEVFELVKMVALFLIIFWGLKSFVIGGYEVQGPSMYPTLEDKERILVMKLPHRISQLPIFKGFTAIDPGDIVVFDSQIEENKRYVKRVIAVGPKRTGPRPVNASETNDTPAPGSKKVVFDHGAIFVDNHRVEESYLQPEERNSLDFHEAYVEPGEYYVLGDHRSVSRDSRSFDAVDDSQIVGHAVFRFWPLSRIGLL